VTDRPPTVLATPASPVIATSTHRWRLIAFAAIVAACLVGAVFTVLRLDRVPVASVDSDGEPPSENVLTTGYILFRRTALDGYAALMAVPADAPHADPVATGLACERVHAAEGVGICLTADRGVLTTYHAFSFGPDFTRQHDLPLTGIPSRARVPGRAPSPPRRRSSAVTPTPKEPSRR
jgi:hypothetical protein